jgi:hypothetical protein
MHKVVEDDDADEGPAAEKSGKTKHVALIL